MGRCDVSDQGRLFERKNTPPCPHESEFGEGVLWPDDVSLAHLDNCLTPAGRLAVWTAARRTSDAGSRCVLENHRAWIGQLRDQLNVEASYIRSMLAQLRELEADLRSNPQLEGVAERLAAIIGGTSVQSVTRVL